MNFDELTRRLYAARRGGVKLELERTRRLLAGVGNPQNGFACVQIGGTNGKGSTSAFVEAIARSAGARVGLYTSPHLSRVNERVRIDGSDIADADLLAAGETVEAAVDAMGPDDVPTFFERITAIGLVAFARAGVELAVLEVGLGGRFDATSAVDRVAVAVTGVALDHQDYLGDTLEAIAAEKAGVFAPGQHAVIGCSGEPRAVPWLRAAAEAAGVRALAVVDEGRVAELAARGWPLALDGPHQLANAACALAVYDALELAGVIAPARDARPRGLATARLPGRMETIDGTPPVILDGAHNPHGAAALARALEARGIARVQLVMGWSSDKDGAGLIAPLAHLADGLIATRASSERAASPEHVARVASEHGLEVISAPDVGAALGVARTRARDGEPIVVCGSLFVVGEARACLGLAVPEIVALRDPV